MARFAPVSLVFFLGALFFMTVLRGLPLHPVHFAFMSASFFAFNLLFAHLVDHVELTLSFAISAAVSMTLVVTYLRKVVSPLFAWREAALLQLLFLVLFARAHFTQGWTGLTVTIGGIVTLFVVMQATAKVDWNLVFPDSREPPPGPLPLP
jgi:inner membrane protein involved in colicin E2 resistance